MHLSARFCKTRIFHLHHHWVAFTSTYPCWGKPIHHKHIHLHLHPHEGHLHYKYIHLHLHPHKRALAFQEVFICTAPSHGCIHVCIFNKDFCIRHSMNKYLHLHLHPHEGHLHNKISIRIITRLRSYLYIQ